MQSTSERGAGGYVAGMDQISPIKGSEPLIQEAACGSLRVLVVGR